MICQRCDQRQDPPYTGACACKVDGRDIRDHAAGYDCPRGMFRPRGLGDRVAELLRRSGLAGLWDRFLADTAPCRWPTAPDPQGRPDGCGCDARRAALNRLFPFSEV